MKVSLKNLINRIDTATKFLNEYPENKDILERKISETKELIFQCVLQNKDNKILEYIYLMNK